jgi:glycosyltransferase involved in cell wall biosynthesis
MRSSVPVCFVVSHAQLGGAEVYLASLLRVLGREWIDRVVVLARGPFVERLRDAGIDASVVPCGARFGLLTGAMRLRRALRERPDVIHANGVKAALVGVLATARTGVPVIWHKHDLARDGRIARWVARRCSLVIGVSAAAISGIEGKAVATAVIPNGIQPRAVDRRQARNRLLAELDAPASARMLCVVGRLHPGKGQLELVAVLPDLLERDPELRLVIVGGADPYEAAHEELLRSRTAELGLEGSVAFLGHRDDAIEIIAGCDVLAAPSMPDPVSGWREGFGLAALEAMAVGTPVAGYAEAALTETLGDCAALVPTGDRERLRGTIARILADERERSRLAECGRERARRFELPVSAARMKQAYLAVAGVPRG